MSGLRRAQLERCTGETQIEITLDLDNWSEAAISTGIGFFDHMLELLALHAGVGLSVRAEGDVEVDDHHLVEDVGIVLGGALEKALGEKQGIRRYGSATLPMDEVLVVVACDLGGRFAFRSNYSPVRERLGDLSCEMVNHFFSSLACQARMNLHFHFLDSGDNEHHRVEAMFKGFARALSAAAALDPRRGEQLPSTKGVL